MVGVVLFVSIRRTQRSARLYSTAETDVYKGQGGGCFKTSAIIMRAPGASGQLRRSDDWFLFVCPRTKERKKLTKKERKVCRASDWGKGRSAK